MGSQPTSILSNVNTVNDSSKKELLATHTVALDNGDDELFPALLSDHSSEPGDVSTAQLNACQKASQAGPVEDTTISSQINALPDAVCDIAPATQQFFDAAGIQTSELDGPVVDYLCQFITTAQTNDRDDFVDEFKEILADFVGDVNVSKASIWALYDAQQSGEPAS